jgi:hypothetical protein
MEATGALLTFHAQGDTPHLAVEQALAALHRELEAAGWRVWTLSHSITPVQRPEGLRYEAVVIAAVR